MPEDVHDEDRRHQRRSEPRRLVGVGRDADCEAGPYGGQESEFRDRGALPQQQCENEKSRGQHAAFVGNPRVLNVQGRQHAKQKGENSEGGSSQPARKGVEHYQRSEAENSRWQPPRGNGESR